MRLWSKREARTHAIGISRGGRTTKVYALMDVIGRPLRLFLVSGKTSDFGTPTFPWQTPSDASAYVTMVAGSLRLWLGLDEEEIDAIDKVALRRDFYYRDLVSH